MQSVRLDDGQIEVVDNDMAAVLRMKTPAQRIGIGFDILLSARRMLVSHLTSSHPDWDVKQVQEEVLRKRAIRMPEVGMTVFEKPSPQVKA
ncbi:MAG: hypothetical protein P8Z42_03665, partial [Anaerolineales bacterium]